MKRQLLSWLAIGLLAVPLLTVLVAPAALADDDHRGYRGRNRAACDNDRGRNFNRNRNFDNRGYYQNNNWRGNDDGYRRVNYNNGYGDNGRFYGGTRYNNGRPFFQTKAGKITKGGLIGGGIGAATGVLTNRDVVKTGLVGAGVGAGIQAIRYW